VIKCVHEFGDRIWDTLSEAFGFVVSTVWQGIIGFDVAVHPCLLPFIYSICRKSCHPSSSALIGCILKKKAAMKRLFTFMIAACMLPVLSIAQKTMTAEAVRASISNNAPLAITGVQITGDLDLTKLANMKLVSSSEKDGDGKSYLSVVTSPVSFTNCTFTGKVLGYFNPDNGNMTNKSSTVYNTDFEGPLTFENCTFEKEVTFKYSHFARKTSFAGSNFNDGAVFKYSKFKEGPDFSRATFKNVAVFKYVEFPKGFNFSKTTFQNMADFKYAKFLQGGDFSNATFKNNADFKYADFASTVSLKGVSFEGSSDFKYTKLDNQQTSLDKLLGH